MKKEQFFSLIGELDDRFLERYRQMDMRLSYKAMRKKRTLRVLAVAACLCLLIGACVPVGMLIAQLMKSPATPPPTIYLQGLDELEIMREMVECEDEQMLMEYLHSITGGGAQSRQDLIEFLSLVDNTPYAQIIDGEITGLTYYGTDERFSVSAQAENGDSLMISYELGMSDVEKNMEKVARKLGKKNLLSAPLSTQDGRLTLYTETREPSSNGEVIRWQGVLDGVAVYIVYWVADADAVDTAALLDRLKIADAIAPKPLQTEPDTTESDTTEPDTTEPEGGKPQGNGSRIWDSNHPDDSERYPYFSITFPSLRNARVEHKEDGTLYLNGEYLLGGSENGCNSFYMSDLTGDGTPELCFGMNFGGDVVDRRIVIVDFKTKKTVFAMEGREVNDYYLFLRNGVLCVKETEYMKRDAVRTGVLSYNGSEISIVWDSEVNATVDRDQMPNPGAPVS